MSEWVIVQDVRRDIGGDEQRVHDVDTDWSDETFKHILLPVWMAAYKYNGKSYRFLVNGQTGEVQGERPWSIWKIGFAVPQRPRDAGPAPAGLDGLTPPAPATVGVGGWATVAGAFSRWLPLAPARPAGSTARKAGRPPCRTPPSSGP
jgi:hypothetical protein